MQEDVIKCFQCCVSSCQESANTKGAGTKYVVDAEMEIAMFVLLFVGQRSGN